MIIVKLQGGLGNQMFQYAAGKNLAVKYNIPLFLDHSFLESNNQSFEGFTARNFELEVFDITDERVSTAILERTFNSGFIKKVSKKLFNKGIKVYYEPSYAYDVTFERLKPPVYLDGYWQSEKYFKNIENTIRSNFSFKKNEVIEVNSGLVNQLKNNNSVSVHFRRGDYVGYSTTSQRHGICPPEYYKQAMDMLYERTPDVFFFIFSDDPEWVKKNLEYPNAPFYVVETNKSNKQTDWLDMYLMSICKHNIIANSSFSWWSAWLNANPDKSVVAPKNWFNTPPNGFDIHNLLPKKWIRI